MMASFFEISQKFLKTNQTPFSSTAVGSASQTPVYDTFELHQFAQHATQLIVFWFFGSKHFFSIFVQSFFKPKEFIWVQAPFASLAKFWLSAWFKQQLTESTLYL